MRVKTLIQWTDPQGNRHEPGAVEDIDEIVVFDLADLIKGGTVEVVTTAIEGDETIPVRPRYSRRTSQEETT